MWNLFFYIIYNNNLSPNLVFFFFFDKNFFLQSSKEASMTFFFSPLHILSVSNPNLALGLRCSSVRAWVNLNVSLCGCNLAADPVIRQALQSPAAGHSSHFTGCLYSPGWFLLRDTTWLLSEASVPGTRATHTLELHVKLWACPRLNCEKKKKNPVQTCKPKTLRSPG